MATCQCVTFEGTYVVDTAKSEPFEPLLLAMGVGWLKRKAIAMAEKQVQQILSNDDKNLWVEMKTPLKTKQEHFLLDGSEREWSHEIFGTMLQSIRWADDSKQVIETVGRSEKGELVTRRYLEDEHTVVVDMCWSAASGQVVRCHRVFKRHSANSA
eukprot:TRINITY_DN2546_c0_g1_i3.p1 TRINITY_DN2546_c0_g1~~TRINITY_DN2546_c0_g1_i3.p1  ORF type:complete len:176 (-),score=53.17 TRINITY_DN2546_c0_g1_i3:102-569(-)